MSLRERIHCVNGVFNRVFSTPLSVRLLQKLWLGSVWVLCRFREDGINVALGLAAGYLFGAMATEVMKILGVAVTTPWLQETIANSDEPQCGFLVIVFHMGTVAVLFAFLLASLTGPSAYRAMGHHRGEVSRDMGEHRGEVSRVMGHHRGEVSRDMGEHRGEVSRDMGEHRGEVSRAKALCLAATAALLGLTVSGATVGAIEGKMAETFHIVFIYFDQV
ncbi:hypothetical protein AALO_G00231210 [Alosa alosa]|uniref:Uncharacterized protein n=1 Tax=Alosa alosa TaxID=278164 RepID=A0AAV6FUD9_9TELE|nr:hypothetical protein AALO_G00231210 [Alosa alosa]